MTEREIPLDEVLQFMGMIWAIDHEMERVSKRMEATVGLTIPQRLSLLLVGHRPGMLASDLADVLHLHRGTVTGIVQRLEAAGYVKRTADPEDGRRAGLSLTPSGQRVNARRAGTFEGAVRRVLTAATPRDLTAATRLLSMLSSELRVVAEAEEPAPLT